MKSVDWLLYLLVPCVALFAFEMFRSPPISASSVTIADAHQGEDPPVVYARTIHRDTRMTWSVSVIGTDCFGSGTADYPAGTEALHWKLIKEYIEGNPEDCNLPPGTYPVQTRYTWWWGLREYAPPPTTWTILK